MLYCGENIPNTQTSKIRRGAETSWLVAAQRNKLVSVGADVTNYEKMRILCLGHKDKIYCATHVGVCD